MAVIEVSGLTKDYGEIRANDDLSFTVEEGEIFGYLGPNGAGKTTTIRTLMGLQSPTAGSATVLGHDVRDERELIEAKRHVGYLPDDPSFDQHVTGSEVLDLHAAYKGDERREELLELFEPPLSRRVREYSRGNVQKLGIVAAFMHDPDLVVLDEPTSGLDPLLQRRFDEFLQAERREGTTVFFSSHVLGEVRRLCDRVAILRDGRLVTTERIDSLLHRTGKLVRLRAVGSVAADAFDGDGVHDLEASTAEVDAQSDGLTADVTTVTDCQFTFTGDVDELVDRLDDHRLLELNVEEAPLEEVFMRFYGGEADA